MIRLGIVGYGHRATCLVTGTFPKVEPGFRVVGAVDPAEDKVRGRLRDWGCEDQKDLPFYPDLDTLVRKAKPDGLLIGTDCRRHAPFAMRAARYDLPLYLEKPVAVSMAQATALERAFRDSRCEVVVSFPLRSSPLCTEVRRAIEAGEIGRPEHIAGLNYVPYGACYFEGGPGVYESMQGLFLQKATHDIDYMAYLMGSRVTRVAALACRGRVFGGRRPSGLRCSACPEAWTCPESPRNRERNGSVRGRNRDHGCVFSVDCGDARTGMNEDASSCLMEFESGAHGVYTQVFFSRRDAACRGATVSGYHGTIAFDWYRKEIRRVAHHRPFTATLAGQAGEGHFGGDEELALDFFDLIKGRRRRSRTPIETGLASAYACLACKRSAEEGRFVKVRPVSL